MSEIELPDVDLPEPSRVFDVETRPPTPLALQLLQLATLKVQSEALKYQIKRESSGLESRIRTELGELKAGYLLRINIYSDEHGQAVIPGGQIVLPVGVGTEPLDALAELLRLPGIEASPPPASVENYSSYVWLFKKNGKLFGRTIPKELRSTFEKSAREEAIARQRLSEWIRIVPDSAWERIQRADFWQKVYAEKSQLLEDQGRRQQIEALTKRMNELQDQINQSTAQFRDILREMAEQSSALDVIAAGLQVVSIINSAISRGDLTDSRARKVGSKAEPELPAEQMAHIRTRAYERSGEKVRTLEIELQGPIEEIKRTNDRILQEWHKAGVAVTPAENPPRRLIPWYLP
jgi:hypothetical protein